MSHSTDREEDTGVNTGAGGVLVQRTGRRPVAETVTSVELFFDLVFAFAVGQLTLTLGDHLTPAAFGRVALLLALMWWMYGGYAWLTNAVPPVTVSRRLFLLAGMGANFFMALAVPRAFEADGVTFAVAYAVVVLVHAGMYLTQAARVTRGMVMQLVVGNGLAAVLVLAGALIGGSWRAAWWVAALAATVALPRALGSFRAGPDEAASFEVQPGHFVERHGLMLIIVLGESVLEIGVGITGGVGDGSVATPARLVVAAVSLALAATLYWAYFGSDEGDAAEAALHRAGARAQHVALNAFGLAFAVILLGMVLLASTMHHVSFDPQHAFDWASAVQLGGGAALVWLGLCAFRVAIGRPAGALRIVAIVASAACAFLATAISGMAGMLGLLVVSVAVVVAEHLQRPPADLDPAR